MKLILHSKGWAALLLPLCVLLGCTPTLDTMKASTVRVLCRQGEDIAASSGFVIGRGQHVATNWHAVRCSAEGGQAAVLPDQQQLAPARVIWRDPVRDLAILELSQPLDRPVAPFITHDHVQDDEPVFVLGFPGAADDVGDSASLMMVKVNRGGISARLRSEQGIGLYQIDAAINPGNSGGPVFNEAGQIIGISVMKSLALVPGLALDTQGQMELNLQRVPLAENIAWAVHIDELLPGLRAAGVPYTVDNPGPLAPLIRLIRHEPIAATGMGLALLLGGCGLFMRGRWRFALPGHAKPASVPGPELLLRGLRGPFAGNTLELPTTPLALGRDPRLCQLVFPAEYTNIGRQHARLWRDAQAERIWLEDCGSTNGTFLDSGERLSPHQPHSLLPGTRFYLGSQAFQFEITHAPPRPVRPGRSPRA